MYRGYLGIRSWPDFKARWKAVRVRWATNPLYDNDLDD